MSKVLLAGGANPENGQNTSNHDASKGLSTNVLHAFLHHKTPLASSISLSDSIWRPFSKWRSFLLTKFVLYPHNDFVFNVQSD